MSSFLGEPISFKKSIPYLNIDLGWWNFQKLMRTYLSWSGKNLVGETLFLHGQNFANMFYFHLFSAWTVIVSWHINLILPYMTYDLMKHVVWHVIWLDKWCDIINYVTCDMACKLSCDMTCDVICDKSFDMTFNIYQWHAM